MGKQQEKQKKKEIQNKDESKKVIKKFPFKSMKNNNKGDQEELKMWKPMKIQDMKEKERSELTKQKSNLVANFLSFLPPPQQKPQSKSSFLEQKMIFKMPPQQKKVIKPTQQQLKYDIQDEQFINKQFLNHNKKDIQHHLIEEDDGEEYVQRIKWLNEDPQKMKQIDLTKVIDGNWKAASDKSKFQTQIFNTSFLKGKGQLSDFVKEAIQKFDEDQLTMNRRSMIKQKNRARYGW